MEESSKEIEVREPKTKEERLERKWFRSLFVLTEELGGLVNPAERDEFALYYPFLGAIFDYAKLEEGPAKLEAFKKEIYKKPIIDYELARQKAQELVEMSPLDGMKVLEIGGPFVQVLHLLGAEKAICIDPAAWPYNPERKGYHGIFERFDFTNPQQYVGKDDFDLVLTREVLSTGSGLTRRAFVVIGKEILTHKFGGKEPLFETDVYQGMLSACAQLTKEGGLNIHAGDCVAQKDRFFSQIRLEAITKATGFNVSTFVFRKR